MEKKARRLVEKEGILTGVKSLLLAVSGGADSIALADWVTKEYGHLEIALAHLNHGLRRAADAEEAFVRDFGRERGLPVYVKKTDIAQAAKDNKIGLEEAGRLARYGYFRQLMRDIPAQVTLTAHHRDDQAETVLANLLRGSGLEGLAAMEPIGCGLGRPFLDVTKEEILAYCSERGLRYMEDESNCDPAFLRNRLRHRLLPELETYNPRIREALCRLAALCREDNDALNEAALELFSALRQEEGAEIAFDLEALSYAPAALQSRLVRLAAEAVCPYRPLDYEKTRRVLALSSGGDLAFGDGLFIRRRHNRLFFSPLPPNEEGEKEWQADLALPGVTAVKGGEILVEAVVMPGPESDASASFPQSLFRDGAVFRNRRPGDRIALPRGGRKKLQDYWIDKKVPREERGALPLLAVGSRVLWIPGHGVFPVEGEMGDGPYYRFWLKKSDEE